jgi:hypothetical protein
VAWIDDPFPDAETIDPDQAMKLMVIGATRGWFLNR